MLRMTTISKIRCEHFVNKKSPHKISQELGISWATTKNYLEKSPDEITNMGKRPHRCSTVGNEQVQARIHEYLQQEKVLGVKKKQRYTANGLYNILREEGLFTGHPRYFRKLVKKEKEKLSHGC